jgi:hypothetical protein
MPKICKKGVKIACIITGKTTYFAEMFLEKKRAKYGSVDEFAKWFVCNEAKRMLRKGMTVDEIRAELKCDPNLPKVDIEILYRKKLLKKKKDRGGSGKIFSEEEKQKLTEEQAKKILDYQSDVKAYGAQGAWIREHTYTSNGIGVCLRPDIYLNNDETCGLCEYYEFCLCRIWNRRKK